MTSDQENNLRMMLSKLAEFEEGRLAHGSLIPELEGLFNAVGIADRDWRERFWDWWGELEINYAYALDMGWKSLDETSRRLVSQAAQNLRTLVVAKLREG